MKYLYRLISSNYWPIIDGLLKKLHVEHDYVMSGDWKLYRVEESQFSKLPYDQGPYLPTSEGDGFALGPDRVAEQDAEHLGGWQKGEAE
jgi:hypothetical protein